MDPDAPIAWVESPLQLISAAEWASSLGRRIVVAHRLTGPQMERTAAELLARGASFSSCVPFFGIPWHLLSSHRHWAIGDAFSGQFRLAATVVRPDRVTLIDDGAQGLAVADALLGRHPYARPHVRESRSTGLLGTIARERMLRLAARDRLAITTAFPLGDERTARLEAMGATVTRHRLDWVRRTARPVAFPGNRVLLGSALPTDGRVTAERYLGWVKAEATVGELSYFPHRRESDRMLAAIAGIPGVTVRDLGLPIELVLAGTTQPLELIGLGSSAQTTLAHLLEGTGSVLRNDSVVGA